MTTLHALILAGGSGTRFWPVSRAAHPKQFLDILGQGKTLLQATIARVQKLLPPDHIWIAANPQHADLLSAQLPTFPQGQILFEPLARNTAPPILWAALHLARREPEAVLWILPADQYIPDEGPFIDLMRQVFATCDFSEAIFTVGIKPRYPHTGYGYIQYVPGPGLCHPVKTFTEKPSRELAELFLQSGDFLWNSGMFIASLAVILRAFQEKAPEIYEAFQDINLDDPEALRSAFQRVPAISFDYAIMEKYHPVKVVEGHFAWWDLGGWKALHEVSPHDEHGNTRRAQVYTQAVRDTLFFSAQPHKLIIAQGLDGYLVLDTEEALVILPQSEEQSLREWVQRLRTEGKVRYL